MTSNTHARRIGEKLETAIGAIPLGATREEARRPATTHGQRAAGVPL